MECNLCAVCTPTGSWVWLCQVRNPQRYALVRMLWIHLMSFDSLLCLAVNRARRGISISCYEYHLLLVPILEWVPMGEGSVTVPVADDGATEVTIPIGFRFGDSIHHDIYVSSIYKLCGLMTKFVLSVCNGSHCSRW